MRRNPTKRNRLTKTEFKKVLRTGARSRIADMKIIYSKQYLEQVRFAVSVGKKYGNAVERNRAKRVLREAYYTVCESIPHGYDLVMIVYEKDISFLTRCTQLTALLKKIKIG
ncbi:ribonuclease P protein component [Entomospira nematocerorum]|uniref:Ribonuclease P protein component n=1 Tax=Entomospira nematocerorum TaxID=2719987 RepID=A0A968GFM8_9SPIO|nr:ribonuclease P protein component [Entomospira nematocera]NIZ46901.1 ribonuclease P protein component [Entomospira nematocera]WDI33301.1 ribonuclease P protein component [Entomospira nematocera]